MHFYFSFVRAIIFILIILFEGWILTYSFIFSNGVLGKILFTYVWIQVLVSLIVYFLYFTANSTFVLPWSIYFQTYLRCHFLFCVINCMFVIILPSLVRLNYKMWLIFVRVLIFICLICNYSKNSPHLILIK